VPTKFDIYVFITEYHNISTRLTLSYLTLNYSPFNSTPHEFATLDTIKIIDQCPKDKDAPIFAFIKIPLNFYLCF